jgi:hypothetical protein
MVMKKNVWIFMLLFIINSISMKILAQENFDALIRKYETMSSVNIDRIRPNESDKAKKDGSKLTIRDKGTTLIVNETTWYKFTGSEVIKISFLNDTTLYKEFIAELKKYEEKDNSMQGVKYFLSTRTLNSEKNKSTETSIYIIVPKKPASTSE